MNGKCKIYVKTLERGESPWADVFTAISNPYRRQLLEALLDHNPQDDGDQDPLDILNGEQQSENIELSIIHKHLPKLYEMGFIEWDRDTNEISKGPEWDEIEPVLTLIHEHRDELPDGWLESRME